MGGRSALGYSGGDEHQSGGQETDFRRGGAPTRAAAQAVAREPPSEPARAGPPGADLHPAPELRGDRAVDAEPRDGAAPRGAARPSAARAQPATAGCWLRPGLRTVRFGLA